MLFIEPSSNYPRSNESSEEVFIKGGSFNHIGGVDDTFILTINNDQYDLSRGAFKETIEDLLPFANVMVTDLKGLNRDAFFNVVNSLKMIKKSDDLYPLFKNDIEEVFKSIKDINPGTVAAYFIGCDNISDYFSDEHQCDPKCSSSLNDDNSVCEDTILIYHNGDFIALNNSNSSTCYIYIGPDEDLEFTRDNIKSLKNGNISSVILVYGNSDGSYKEITDPIPIKQLTVHDYHEHPASENGNHESNGINKTGIAIGIGFSILALIILLLILWRNSRLPYFN